MAVKKVVPKITFSFTIEQLTNFLSKIKELVRIEDRIIFKLTEKNLLLYSTVTKGKQIHAFKSYIFNTNDIMSLNDEVDKELTLIIRDAKKFIQNLTNYLEFATEVTVELTYSEINGIYFSDMMKISNGKLKLTVNAGDPVNINTSITIDNISKFSDIKNSLFDFDIDLETFNRVKKMGTINATAKKTTNPTDIDPLTLSITDNKLVIGELRWNLEICDIEREDEAFSFPKKYFNTITMKDKATIYVFDSFILTKTENSELLIAMETSV